MVKDEKEKLYIFDENGLYLATKKIGKNNSKAEQMQMPMQKPTRQPVEKETQAKPKIPPKPVMPAEASTYIFGD